jgi:hypothetical protein
MDLITRAILIFLVVLGGFSVTVVLYAIWAVYGPAGRTVRRVPPNPGWNEDSPAWDRRAAELEMNKYRGDNGTGTGATP